MEIQTVNMFPKSGAADKLISEAKQIHPLWNGETFFVLEVSGERLWVRPHVREFTSPVRGWVWKEHDPHFWLEFPERELTDLHLVEFAG